MSAPVLLYKKEVKLIKGNEITKETDYANVGFVFSMHVYWSWRHECLECTR